AHRLRRVRLLIALDEAGIVTRAVKKSVPTSVGGLPDAEPFRITMLDQERPEGYVGRHRQEEPACRDGDADLCSLRHRQVCKPAYRRRNADYRRADREAKQKTQNDRAPFDAARCN